MYLLYFNLPSNILFSWKKQNKQNCKTGENLLIFLGIVFVSLEESAKKRRQRKSRIS